MFYSKLLLLATIIFCISCHNKIDDKLEQELIATLEENNKMLDNAASDVFAEFQKRKEKPETREKAEYWFPKIQLADSFLHKLIDSFQTPILESEQIVVLYKNYSKNISSIEKRATEEMKDSLLATRDSLFNQIIYAQKRNKINSNLLMRLYLNKAFISRNNFINWCLKQIGTTGGGYDKFMGIASQNSTHFKPNEQLEIYAGVGQFNYKTQTQVLINQRPIITNSDGIAEYKINVGNQKGKFSKKVSIIFSNFYTQKDTVTKQIFYTVD